MSVQVRDSDVEALHRMGYAQELMRRMSTFSNFAVSFTIISILSGCLTLYAYGMNTGGPIIMNIGWPLVGIFVTLVGLAMAEVCSSFPTAGGLYYWAAKLGGKNGAAWSWFTGWFNLLGQVAVTAGLRSAKEALEGGERVVYKIMSTGTQVSPDMLQPEAFPDWGPEVQDVSKNLDLWRRALPPETLHTTTTAWEIDDKTLVELYLIWHMTGVLDMIKAVDEGLHMILNDVMEELLEDHDIVVPN